MTEALAIGVIGSAAGLAVGIGLAFALKWMFAAIGIELPDGPMVISTGSMLFAAAIGVAVVVLSAWLPARRAGKIAPIAALRDVAIDRTGSSKRRPVVGAIVTGGGVAVLLAGLGGERIQLVGLGALLSLVGVAVLGPVFARPVVGAFGIIVGRRGISGDMAIRNARRNPKRTARTASSLMIGVALVAFIAVFASSVKASLGGSLDDTFTGSHIVESGAWEGVGGFSPALADQMERDASVDTISESRVSTSLVDGSEYTLEGVTAATIGTIFDLGDVQGGLADLGPDGLAVDATSATERGWELGTVVPITFAGIEHPFVVRATYSNASEWVGKQFVDIAAFDTHLPAQLDYRIYAIGDDAAIRNAAAAYPSATVMNADEFLDDITGQLDLMLGVIYALLALAVLIALLGIANTLALSIHERTRELGLLRAVGMLRSQLRSTIRWESIMIALFGTTLGLAVGSFFGWATVRALNSEGIDQFTYPLSNIGVIVAIACLAGAAAAVVPARRAARLHVLNALTANCTHVPRNQPRRGRDRRATNRTRAGSKADQRGWRCWPIAARRRSTPDSSAPVLASGPPDRHAGSVDRRSVASPGARQRKHLRRSVQCERTVARRSSGTTVSDGAHGSRAVDRCARQVGSGAKPHPLCGADLPRVLRSVRCCRWHRDRTCRPTRQRPHG